MNAAQVVTIVTLLALLAGGGWGAAVGLWFARRDLQNETRSLRDQVAAALTARGQIEFLERKAQGRSL